MEKTHGQIDQKGFIFTSSVSRYFWPAGDTVLLFSHKQGRLYPWRIIVFHWFYKGHYSESLRFHDQKEHAGSRESQFSIGFIKVQDQKEHMFFLIFARFALISTVFCVST